MQQVLYWMGDHWGYIALALSMFIDWNPKIKWNPWKSLFSWVGKALTKDVMHEVESIKADLVDVKKEQKRQEAEVDENEMDRIRSEVLDFANSCRLKRRHTKEEFDHIFAVNDKYIKLLEKHRKKNGRFEDAFDYIQNLYRRCMEENDFL